MLVSGRILALDVGLRRIGIAVSDPMGWTAQGLPTLERQNKRTDLAALRRLVEQYQVERWLLGLPLHMSGDESRQAGYVREFGAWLESQTGLPVSYQDERLTSAEAQRVLDAATVNRRKHKGKIDRLAAVLILQTYLDRLSASAAAPGEGPTR